jgi:hypothetical protein
VMCSGGMFLSSPSLAAACSNVFCVLLSLSLRAAFWVLVGRSRNVSVSMWVRASRSVIGYDGLCHGTFHQNF